jgi:hypothetical protein
MQFNGTDVELESLHHQLEDEEQLRSYKAPYDNYPIALVPRVLGGFLVFCGNLIYGKEPSYLKFRAVEVIARVPYHSWASAAFTLMTMFYTSEKRAMKLSQLKDYAMYASDNETMHVVVISALSRHETRAGILRFTIIPMLFAFLYFWTSYILYVVKPRWSLQTNYLFEQHAFDSYTRFLAVNGEELKKKTIESEYLHWYGRNPRSQYEFFRSVRIDEIIHRNRSIQE